MQNYAQDKANLWETKVIAKKQERLMWTEQTVTWERINAVHPVVYAVGQLLWLSR